MSIFRIGREALSNLRVKGPHPRAHIWEGLSSINTPPVGLLPVHEGFHMAMWMFVNIFIEKDRRFNGNVA